MSNWIENNIKNYIGSYETWKILENKMCGHIPFCYVRFNEGESRVVANISGPLTGRQKFNPNQQLMSMENCEITKVGPGNKRKWGRWTYNQDENPQLRQEMLDALVETGENYHASLCNNTGYVNYRHQTLLLMREHMGDNVPDDILSAHAVHEKEVHDELHKCFPNFDVNVICNEKGNVDNLPFVPKKVWRISNENAWVNDARLPDEINKYIKENDIHNELFLGCAGPFTNILFHKIWKECPSNFYIDAGSTLDYHLFNAPTRNWLNKMGYPKQKRGPELR